MTLPPHMNYPHLLCRRSRETGQDFLLPKLADQVEGQPLDLRLEVPALL